jgi:hypothetical protein
MTLFASPGRPATPVTLTCAAAAALLACLGAAGCSGPPAHPHADSRAGAHQLQAGASGSAGAAPSVLPPTTPAAGPSSAPGSHSSPAPPATTPAANPAPPGVAGPAPLAACSTAGLKISLGAANGAAGSMYYPLDFTNISGAACSMYGYPGVSFVAAQGGAELGGPALRNPTFGPALVTLAAGAVAHASVQVQVAQDYPASRCKPVTAHWLQVYPPGQYAPLYASLTAMTCMGAIPGGTTLGIFAVRPGANGP